MLLDDVGAAREERRKEEIRARLAQSRAPAGVFLFCDVVTGPGLRRVGPLLV